MFNLSKQSRLIYEFGEQYCPVDQDEPYPMAQSEALECPVDDSPEAAWDAAIQELESAPDPQTPEEARELVATTERRFVTILNDAWDWAEQQCESAATGMDEIPTSGPFLPEAEILETLEAGAQKLIAQAERASKN